MSKNQHDKHSPDAAMINANNIIERQNVEEASKKSEAMLRTLLDVTSDSIFLIDETITILMLNKTAAQRLKKEIAEVIGKKANDLISATVPAGLVASRIKKIKQVFKTGQACRFFDKRDEFCFDYSIYPIYDQPGKVIQVAIFARDITEQIHVEESLHESEERLLKVIQNMPVMMDALDEQQNFIVWNHECERITGYRSEEIVGNPHAFELLYPDPHYRTEIMTEWQRYGDDFRNWEIDITTKSGAVKTIAWSNISRLIPVPGWASWAVGIDVTERNEFELALGKSEEMYRLLIENASEAISVIQDGILKFVNSRVEEVSKYTREELIGKSIIEFIHPDDRMIAKDISQRRMQDENVPIIYQIRIFDKSGEIRWLQISGVKIQWESRAASLNFSRDITAQKKTEQEKIRLEQRLVQVQKMELIGRLSSGIAHDFNNLLSPILSYAGMMLLEMPQNNPYFSKIKSIFNAADRAKNITKQLLAIGKKEADEIRILNLSDEIIQLQTLMNSLIKQNIRIQYRLSNELGNIKIDSSYIQQIVMNLIINSNDAMPEGGTIIMETKNVTFDESYCKLQHELKPGKYVMLLVSDTGQGMDAATRDHIFDLFYTTKEKDQGTGLGLVTVHDIVKQHNGSIHVDSKPGLGTTFKLYLPRVEEKVTFSD